MCIRDRCYAHVECDAIIKGEGQVKAVPEIFAKNVDANLIHCLLYTSRCV